MGFYRVQYCRFAPAAYRSARVSHFHTHKPATTIPQEFHKYFQNIEKNIHY